MSTLDFLWVVGSIVGGVLVVVVGSIVGLFIIIKLGGALAGLPRVRASLVARGIDPRLADRMFVELETTTDGMTLGILAVLAGGLALAFGLYTLSRTYAPELDETLVYSAPGLLLLAIGAWLLVRSRRIDADRSATHRALVTRAGHVTTLVPTMIWLNLDVTTAADALTSTRVTQWRPIPHVIVIFDDGTEHAVRAFHDGDAFALELAHCLSAMLPHARLEPFAVRRASGPVESRGAASDGRGLRA